jgi:hypothetical protein
MQAIKKQEGKRKLLYQSAHCTECSGLKGISVKFMETLIEKAAFGLNYGSRQLLFSRES